jgi:hypothetical protein
MKQLEPPVSPISRAQSRPEVPVPVLHSQQAEAGEDAAQKRPTPRRATQPVLILLMIFILRKIPGGFLPLAGK